MSLETTPDAISASQGKSLFHKSANVAIGAIIAAFVLQFFYSKIAGNLSPRASAIAGLLPTAVIISAIPAGAIALCGIPRFGPRKLLWKGAVGMIVPIVLFFVSIYIARELRSLAEHYGQQTEIKK